jgi:ribonuclease BN (tRNA processing enzyme)
MPTELSGIIDQTNGSGTEGRRQSARLPWPAAAVGRGGGPARPDPKRATVKLTLIPSTLPGSGPEHFQFLSCCLVNDTIALDAGSLGFYRPAHDQARIRHVLLTHTHIDHLASLPIFVENAFEGKPDPVTI